MGDGTQPPDGDLERLVGGWPEDTDLVAWFRAGDVTGFPSGFAAYGVDELLLRFAGRPGRTLPVDTPRSMVVRATDVPRTWRVTFTPSGFQTGADPIDANAELVVIGDASDLYVVLWNRRGTDGLDLDGNRICSSSGGRPADPVDLTGLPVGFGQSGGAGFEVAPLRDAHRAPRGQTVRVAGGGVVTGHLLEVGAHRGQLMVAGQPFVGVQGFQHVEPGLRPSHHRDRDGVVLRDHRVGRSVLQQLVQTEDLRPVRVLRTRRFRVDRGDRRLQLIRTESSPRHTRSVSLTYRARCPIRGEGDHG